MNWRLIRSVPWLDTRASFVSQTPHGGALLDLGSSDGETLRHFYELRPDLKFHAVDIQGRPEAYPKGCDFRRANLQKDSLPWPDASMDAVTCMHLVEHLSDLTMLLHEVSRLLKPGAKAYFETPHPKTTTLPSARGAFTFNFYDDPTHTHPVPIDDLSRKASSAGLRLCMAGTSRNWLFAAAWPIFALMPHSRQKFTSRVHWIGWSACGVFIKPNEA